MFKDNKEAQNKLNLFLMNYFVLIVLAVTAFAVYFGYFFIIKPKESDIESNIKIIISEKERDIVVLQDILNKINTFQVAYGRISENEKGRLEAMLPYGDGKNNLYSDIENMILRQGLILESISVEEKSLGTQGTRTREAAEENIRAGALSIGELNVSLKLSGVGNYEKMKTILELFENNLRLMDITRLGFNFESGAIELDFKTYFLKNR